MSGPRSDAGERRSGGSGGSGGSGRRGRSHRGARVGRGDVGAATVLVVTMASVLLLVGCATAAVGGLLHARRAAALAADLAALAGAGAVQRGEDGCAVAAGIVRVNGAAMRRCVVDGEDVLVTAAVRGPSWVGPDVRLEATARAGPAG